MNQKPLGTTGISVSALCLGTMTFGREADKKTSGEIFHRCREAGINLFDCADLYAHGESEKILGELIAGCRDEIVLTSKVYFDLGVGLKRAGLSRRHILQAVEASLRRLKTDRIDLYFLHHFDAETPLEDSLQAMDDLVRQGKVVYIGASNFAAWQYAKALGISARTGGHRLACIQPMYNLVKRQAEVEILPLARAEGLGVITYSPLGGGLLTGKYTGGFSSAEGRLAHDQIYQRRYGDAADQQHARTFTAFARAKGLNPAALAMAWVMHHPAVTAPIIGARNLAQLEDSLQAATLPMTPDLYKALCELTPTPPPATDRREEAEE